MADPVFDSMLRAIQDLVSFQKNQAVEARRDRIQDRNLESVNRANTQATVPAGLMRQAGAGAQLSSASTQDLVQQEFMTKAANSAISQSQDRTAGPRSKSASTPPGSNAEQDQRSSTFGNKDTEQAVAWSLLGEQGIGGPLGRFATRKYSMQKNLQFATQAGDKLQTNLLDATGESNAWGPRSALVSAATLPITKLSNTFDTNNPNYNRNLTLATGGYYFGSKMFHGANNWIDTGQALGYGTDGPGAYAGVRSPFSQTTALSEGESLWRQKKSLEGWTGHVAGLPSDVASTVVERLADQGWSNNPWHGGNVTNITDAAKPFLNRTRLSGVEAVAALAPALRESGASLTAFASVLNVIPDAAKSSQLGIEGYTKALEANAQTFSSLGGGPLQGGVYTNAIEQAAPGINPEFQGQMAKDPMWQETGMGMTGGLPSGLANAPAGVINAINAQYITRGVAMYAGLNKPNVYQTVDGKQMLMQYNQQNDAAQFAAQHGYNITDVERYLKAARNPQQQDAIQKVQNFLGQGSNGYAPATGLDSILGASAGDASKWKNLSAADRKRARDVWSQDIDPRLKAAGLSAQEIHKLDSVSNIAQRAYDLNNKLTGGDKAGTAANPNTPQVQVNISLKQDAAKYLKATVEPQQQHLPNWWRRVSEGAKAGGPASNVYSNSPSGQNPFDGGSGTPLPFR